MEIYKAALQQARLDLKKTEDRLSEARSKANDAERDINKLSRAIAALEEMLK